ncbi:glycosyltransferase [Arthrobacter sp. ZGTC212]|uniref:glycosyltransferase n=1 Tax=Arthrobacter sp. ZGTC212 TaxID=2058899 RepID=UPI000CE54E98
MLVLTSNLHVVSDGSTGATSVIAEAEGVNCLEPHPNRGKASALAAGIEYYALASNYEGMLLLDADTRLMPDYVKNRLPRFAAPDVVRNLRPGEVPPCSGCRKPVGWVLLSCRERTKQHYSTEPGVNWTSLSD